MVSSRGVTQSGPESRIWFHFPGRKQGKEGRSPPAFLSATRNLPVDGRVFTVQAGAVLQIHTTSAGRRAPKANGVAPVALACI